jgi:pimeloyl-ACP methyl ester carboxylesterase
MNVPSSGVAFPWRGLDFMTEADHVVGKRRLNLAHSGSAAGTTVLFLHGVLRNWRTFFALFEGLRERFCLAALDFRGHGLSDRTPGAYHVTHYVEDARAILPQLDARRLVLHGHSLGAMVALAVAAEAPDRVHGIVLEDPPGSTMGAKLPGTPLGHYLAGVRACMRERSTPEALFDCFSDIIVGECADGAPLRVRDQRDELSRRFSTESLALLDPAVLEPIVAGRWLEGFDLTALAGRVRCPVWLLQADPALGGMLNDNEAEGLSSHLAAGGVERIRFPGAGHSLHWAQPARLIEIIRAAGECDPEGGKKLRHRA